MTESDLLGCKHLHNEFWCIDNQIAKKISHNSCVKSLFEKNLKDILEQCPITTVTPQEYLHQLNTTTFYGFSPMSQNVHITCQKFDDRTGLISHKLSEKTIKGFFVIEMQPACSGAMKEHIFSTHNNLVVNYDLKLEEFEIDLDLATTRHKIK